MLISVIVPVYRVEPYLEECLDSILRQTWKDLDIILVDDGSPDACGEICDRYVGKDPRVRVFHTENRGISAARNLGIRAAWETDSRFLVFTDSDDWLEDDMIEKMAAAALDGGADIVMCGEYLEYPDKTTRYRYGSHLYTGREAARELVLKRMSSHVMNKIWRKECFETLRFPEGRTYEDIPVVCRAFRNSARVMTLEDILYHYRKRRASITHVHGLKHDLDHWLSIRERYEFFLSCEPDDTVLLDACLMQCIRAAGKLWTAYGGASKDERAQYAAEVETAAAFIREQLPLFGRKDWPADTRILSALTHRASGLSFAATRLVDTVRYREKRKNKKFF